MTALSIGDLAQSLLLRRQNAALKTRLTQLGAEMASGRAADTGRHLGGSFAALSDIEARGARLLAYRTAAAEAATTASAMQATLGRIEAGAGDLARTLLAVSGSTLTQVTGAASRSATQVFADQVQALNTQAAGRSLFAGAASGRPPVAAADTMLNDLRAALAGIWDAATVRATIQDYFLSPAGGYATTAYVGSSDPLSPVPIADGVSVGLDLRADDPALRQVLADTATAALAGDPALGLPAATVALLLDESAGGLVAGQARTTALRADLGFAEARIETAQVRNAAEQSALDIARNDLLSIDPYTTATELEEVRFQLESLYAMTSRLSRLSLTEFLR